MSETGYQGSNLAVRTLSACFFAPIVLGLVIAGDRFLLLLVLLIVGRGSWEFYHMVRRAGHQPNVLLGVGLSAAFCLCAYAAGSELLGLAVAGSSLIVFSATLLQGVRDYTANALLTLGGAIYLGLLGSAPLLIVRTADPEHRLEVDYLLVTLFLCIWLTDAVAYLCGRRWGRKKLAPVISPGKTWVGFITGIGGGLLTGLFNRFLPSFSLAELLGLLLLVSVGGQTGDLVESAIKRDLGVKDAPAVIPGHGGFLDRFDSYLFAFPLAYLYINIFAIF